MDELESKLGAILGNPEMMSKIMSIAQSFESKESSAPSPPPKETAEGNLSQLDTKTLTKLSSLMQQSGVDKNQQNLLRALAPYLSQPRIQKLERAMRAARMATMAGSFFGNGLFSFGR